MKAIWTGSNRLKLLQASRSRSYWDSVWYNHSEEVKVTLKFAYGHIKSYTSVVMPQSHYSCNYGYLRLYRSCDLQCTVLNLVKFGPVTSTLPKDCYTTFLWFLALNNCRSISTCCKLSYLKIRLRLKSCQHILLMVGDHYYPLCFPKKI